MSWSFRTALTLNFVLLASLPTLIVGFFAMKYLTTTMEKEISDKNLILANSCTSELDHFLGDSLHRLEHVVRLLEDSQFILPEKLNDYLAFLVSSDDKLEMVRVLDQGGIVTYLAPFDRNIYGLDMSRQEYCVEAKERQTAYWSNVFISPQTGASTLALAIPFKRGMIVGHLSLSAVHRIIDSVDIGPGENVAVLDRYGTVIAHHNQALVAQRSNLSNQAHIAEGLVGHEGTFRYANDGKEQIGSVALVPGTHWVVAVSQPLDEVFLPIRNLTRILYVGTLLAVLAAIMAAVLSLQRMLSPLRKLTQNARKIAGGSYTLEPVPSSYREIVELSESFKTMIEEVDAREASLRKSEARFRVTFEQAAVGVSHVSPEGRFLRINQKFCDIVGFSHEEMLRKTFQDITYPDGLDADQEYMNQLLAGKIDTYATEKRYIRKDGGLVWIHLTVSWVRNEGGEPQWFVSVVKDISDRKLAEEALRDSEVKFRSLMEQSPLSIQIANPDGRINQVNEAFMKIWGISEETLPEVLEKYNMLEDEEARKLGVFPFIEKAFRGETVILPVIEYDASNTMENLEIGAVEGNKRWIQSRLYPIKNSKGEVVNVVLIEEDITGRKQAEAEIQRYHKRLKALVSQSTLTEERERRRIAADLHDNTGHFLALARMQLDGILESKSKMETTLLVNDISQLLLKAIQDTKNLMYDLSYPAMHEMGLAAALSEWLEEQIGKRYGLQTEFAEAVEDAWKKMLDDDLRTILFRNIRELITNVVKHAQASKVKVSVETADASFKVIVEDDGVGVDPEETSGRVQEGKGFGLFSIRERMVELGGSLEIVSGPNKGFKAIMSLPLKKVHKDTNA